MHAIFYMRDFKRVGTNDANCDPRVKKQKANGFLSFPREPSSPQARLASSGDAHPPGGCALLTRVCSGSSQESAPQPLTHPSPWRGDTTLESNYNPQLTYESKNFTEKGEKKKKNLEPPPKRSTSRNFSPGVKLFDWLFARACPRPPLAEQTRDRREEGAGRGAGGDTLARAAF